VYIAGHGCQLTSLGAIVLLHDFATDDEDDYLYGAIDILECHKRMDEPGCARHQLWLSDACRELPDAAYTFETLSGAYKPGDKLPGRVDSTPLILSSSAREAAWATVGETTIFCQALLSALRGEAGTGPSADCQQWHVPVTRLQPCIDRKTKELLAERAEQDVDITGRPREFVLHRFDRPPHVDIEVNLDPATAHSDAHATLWLGREQCQVDGAWPLKYGGIAGLYVLMLDVSSPYVGGPWPINARPPREVSIVPVRL
jgi:hypothetical protein